MSEDMLSFSNISHWYSGRCVFITGATGFLGKVLMEKLLRSCPDIQTIYVLMRDKRNVSAEDRLTAILNEPLFDCLRKKKLNVFKKIVIIKGDVILPNFGINIEDRAELVQNVSVIYHSAASIKFSEPLKNAFRMNVLGTEEIINLALEMKKLKAFIHVSTAFSNCNNKEVEERLYESPVNLQKLKQLLEILDDEEINSLTPKLLKDWPNTYTFTKALAEQTVEKYVQSDSLPAAILRPAIVTPAWSEPLPGWTDNINGPIGLLLGGGKGIIRSILAVPDRSPCIIPIDLVINLMISVAWYISSKKFTTVPFYNHSAGVLNPVTNKETGMFFRINAEKYPFNSSIWLPKCVETSSVTKHRIHSFLTRTVPAHTVDFGCVVIGKEPFAVKLVKKIDAMMAAYEKFIYEEWKFSTGNIPKLLDNLSHADKEIFNFDVNTISWDKYFENFHLGVKKFILKEKMEDIPKAKIHLQRLKVAYFTSWMILAIFVVMFTRYIFNI